MSSDNNNINAWFEEELRLPVPETTVDFSFVEATLLRRIRECEELGALSLLRMDEIAPEERFDRVEHELFLQVAHYSEYDEPVDECLKTEFDLSENEWKRFSAKLYERIQPITRLPQWEQLVMAPCREPTAGHWEAMESLLSDRISRCDEQPQEPWARCESSEVPAPEQALVHVEELLDEHIEAVESKPVWEQIVGTEEILPFARWERIEENLFEELSEPRKLNVPYQPFWFIVEHYQSLLKTAGALAAAAVLAIAGLGYYHNVNQLVPTVMYRLEGSVARTVDDNPLVGERFSMIDGGSATLINTHGFIEVRNDASVGLDAVSMSRAAYRVDFGNAGTSGARGQVAFFVNTRKKGSPFSVATRDYRIAVTGTYFRVEADLAGRAATRVLEGSVKITGSPFGDTVLHAGQSLQYDPSIKDYRIFSGGPIVNRSDIERMPAVDALLHYKPVAINSSESGAEVRLDGEYCGTTPLFIRLPEGTHSVRVEKTGFTIVDTTLVLGADAREGVLSVTLVSVPRNEYVAMDAVNLVAHTPVAAKTPSTGNSASARSERPAENTAVSATLYAAARSAERGADWRKAVSLYRQVLADPALTPLRREDAMFSIGKIYAERGSNVEQAKESFLTYLAMFPSGTFAGESWLRLAELEFRTNSDHAIQYYLKYFEMFPRHPRIAELQDRVGVIYMQQKRYDKAAGMFEQALGNATAAGTVDHRTIAAHLYRALMAEGESAQAESVRVRYQVSER